MAIEWSMLTERLLTSRAACWLCPMTALSILLRVLRLGALPQQKLTNSDNSDGAQSSLCCASTIEESSPSAVRMRALKVKVLPNGDCLTAAAAMASTKLAENAPPATPAVSMVSAAKRGSAAVDVKQSAALLEDIVAAHIALDGGSSLATSLPGYIGVGRLKQLLFGHGGKLLGFLETRQNMFRCVRTSSKPHVVHFLGSCEPHATTEGELTEAIDRLLCKVCSVLHSHHTKLDQRQGSKDLYPRSVSPVWLTKQCQREMHSYVRLTRFYLDSKVTSCDVGAREWCSVVQELLLPLLQARPASFEISILETNGAGHNSIRLLTPTSAPQTTTAVRVPKQPSRLCAGDEEGLFSVTAGRAAIVIAKLLYKAYLAAGAPNGMSECVDLTAGVGGITVKLAKHFDLLKAFEIDKTRYTALLQNVQKIGLQNVTCLCADSIQAIRCDHGSRNALPAAMLDPPWGGPDHDPAAEITFNETCLEQVVVELSEKVRVLGIKLPLAYDWKRLESKVEALSQSSGGVQVVCVKKVWKQLFVVFDMSKDRKDVAPASGAKPIHNL